MAFVLECQRGPKFLFRRSKHQPDDDASPCFFETAFAQSTPNTTHVHTDPPSNSQSPRRHLFLSGRSGFPPLEPRPRLHHTPTHTPLLSQIHPPDRRTLTPQPHQWTLTAASPSSRRSRRSGGPRQCARRNGTLLLCLSVWVGGSMPLPRPSRFPHYAPPSYTMQSFPPLRGHPPHSLAFCYVSSTSAFPPLRFSTLSPPHPPTTPFPHHT
jgi:hypothetical protein